MDLVLSSAPFIGHLLSGSSKWLYTPPRVKSIGVQDIVVAMQVRGTN